MGWAAAAYQYGILATHWYWIGAIPAMLFLGIVMMPFYYISKTHSVPGYLQLRFGEPSRALSAVSLRLHDRADERHQHVLDGAGDEGRARLGHQLQHLGFVAHGGRLRRAGRLALGDLQRSAAVRADLAGRAADPDSGPDRSRRLDRPAGAHPPRTRRPGLHAPVAHPGLVQRQPHGHPLDRHRARPGLGDLVRLLDHGLPGGAARAGGQGSARRRRWRRSSAPASR